MIKRRLLILFSVLGILAALAVGIGVLDLVGAVAAALALLLGRLLGNLFLAIPALRRA